MFAFGIDAQALTSCQATACLNAQKSGRENLLSPFPMLLTGAPRVAAVKANLTKIESIYQNATFDADLNGSGNSHGATGRPGSTW